MERALARLRPAASAPIPAQGPQLYSGRISHTLSWSPSPSFSWSLSPSSPSGLCFQDALILLPGWPLARVPLSLLSSCPLCQLLSAAFKLPPSFCVCALLSLSPSPLLSLDLSLPPSPIHCFCPPHTHTPPGPRGLGGGRRRRPTPPGPRGPEQRFGTQGRIFIA